MAELRLFLDDDLYGWMEFHNKAINELTGQNRDIKDFAEILIGLGLINLGRVIGPASEEETRDFTLSILLGSLPRKLSYLEMYKKSLEKEQRRLGFSSSD